jgi:hypothetical protein
MTSPLDPSAFPHVWDAIIAHSHPKTLLALRATCRNLTEVAHRCLFAHLVATGSYLSYCPGNEGKKCSHGYSYPHKFDSPSSLSIGSVYACDDLVRLPINPDMRICRTLDICGACPRDELYHLATMVQPHTLRMKGITRKQQLVGTVGPALTVSDAEVALHAFRPHTTIIDFGHTFQWMVLGRPGYLPVPHDTRRLVLHQRPEGPHYTPCGMQDLVIIFSYNLGANATLITEYVFDLVRLNDSITVVGLEDSGIVIDPTTFASGKAHRSTTRIEFRTHAEHRRALSAEQWKMEMELLS